MEYKVIETSILGTNTYIIFNRKLQECIVVDPGGKADAIDKIIRQNECKLKYILLTHCHFDHSNGCRDLKALTDCKIYMSAAEKDFITTFKNLAITVGKHYKKFQPDVLLSGGEKLELCGFDIEVIATPGHTIGSLTYLFDSENIMFVGDTLFKNSYGRVDLPTGNINSMRASMRLLFGFNKNYLLLTGHGESTMLFDEKANNGF